MNCCVSVENSHQLFSTRKKGLDSVFKDFYIEVPKMAFLAPKLFKDLKRSLFIKAEQKLTENRYHYLEIVI